MIERLTLKTLEKYLDACPWYSAGHLEIYKRLSDTPASENLISNVATRLFSRQPLYEVYVKKNGIAPTAIVAEQKRSQNEIIDLETSEKESDVKFYFVGGDYFSKKDFEQVKLDRSTPIDKFIADRPTLLRSALENKDVENTPTTKEVEYNIDSIFDDVDFFTDALATIYAEQGYYKRALEVYAKLILLYPEKSSYFAALVKDLKSKHNL